MRELSPLLALVLLLVAPRFAASQETTDDRAAVTTTPETTNALTEFVTSGPEKWTSPQGMHSTLQVMLLLTVLSMAPAILLMTTSFVRIIVVLGLLKQ